MSEKQVFYSNLVEINEDEIKASHYNFEHFANGKNFVDTSHPYSHDLDIFGDGSLFQFLNRTTSRQGKSRLGDWLNNPGQDEEEIYSRQEAIKELSNLIDWRQDFQATGRMYSETVEAKSEIIAWLGEEALFYNKIFYRIVSYLLPVVTLIVLIFSILGVVPNALITILVLTQFSIIGSKIKKINRVNNQIGKKYELLNKYSRLLVYIENENFGSSYLKGIKQGLIFNNSSASRQIKNLSMIIRSFDSRNNILVYPFLNGILLWDVQCMMRLEKWRETFKNEVPRWLEFMGKIDALSSLACFAFNHQDFVFPEVANNQFVLEARGIGHPLIDKAVRVNNDIDIDHFGRFIIITGANMAGKSTFLRTIGVNYLLALIGAPVCATQFSFRVMKIFTSMRTSDSLLKNESYFYAELKRLKELIDSLSKGEKLFIILDEILKGTNSHDKQTGSMALIEKLVSMKGTGIIATHDLALGGLEKTLPEYISNLCFEIEINGSEILFDYKLKKGITQKMNANLLMKQMGIIN